MEYVFIGIDSLIVSTVYYFYRKNVKLLFNIQNAPEINLSDLNKMRENETVEYAMINGSVEPSTYNELSSHYRNNYKGVIRVFEIKEHGTKIANNFSTDTTRLITRTIEEVPFNLVNQESKFKVNVNKPLNASYLLEELEISYHNFQANEESLASKLLSLFTPVETIRGIETTEKILKNATHLTAFGKLEKIASKNFRLTEPDLKNCSFIITKSSKEMLMDKLKNSIKVYKISLVIFGSFGLIFGAYIAYKKIREYLDKTEHARMIEQARAQRLQNQRDRNRDNSIRFNNQSNNNEINSISDQSTCVICLTNPRELVLVDCGHVCLCFDCLERLPNRNCPICRKRYTSFVPCYLP